MWNLSDIEIENFKSHRHTKYEFAGGKTTMVLGSNLDQNGNISTTSDSNGSGKSAIVQAITTCLLDAYDPKVKKEEYIRKGEESCCVELGLFNNVFSKTLRIKRTFYLKKSSSLEIFENGIKNEQITSIIEGNKKILEILDLSKDDLLNFFLINQDSSGSFFTSSDVSKKSLIGRFIDLSRIDKVVEKIKEKLKSNQVKIRKIESEIDVFKGSRKAFLDILKSNNDLNEEIESEEKRVFRLIEVRKEEILKKKTEQIKLQSEYKTAFAEFESLSSLSNKTVETLERKTKQKEDENRQLKIEFKEIEKLINEAERNSSSSVECPKCKYEFSVLSPETDLAVVKEALKELLELKQIFSLRQQSLENSIESIRKKSYKEKDLILKKNELSLRVKRLKIWMSELDVAVEDIEEKCLRLEVDLSEVSEKIIKRHEINRENVKAKLKDVNLALSQKRSAQKEYQDKLERFEFWNIHFGLKGFKTHLVNKTLSVIQGSINRKLVEFRSDLRVNIKGTKVLKTNEVREEIDVMMTDDGVNFRSFSTFSGGQKQRANICSILIFHQVINSASSFGGLNFIAMDEIFEGLDQEGQRVIFDILNSTGITILVISHLSNFVSFENQITVENRCGISTIRNEQGAKKESG